MPDDTDMERLSGDDMMQLATDASGARLQFVAIAVLDGVVDPDVAAGLLTARIRAIPRLRQHLLRVPRGCGRPIWVDDPDFDIRKHLRTVRCPPPGDRAALLAVASRVIMTRLPLARSPWTSALVTGLAGGRSALIIVLHHVLADGLAGLAILSRLVDGAAGSPGRPHVHRPSAAQLRADARASRRRAIRKLPALPGRLRQAVGELLSGGTGFAARCWVNRGPVGARRALAVATADLAAVACVARKVGGTVNDVVLCAVTGALGESADARGEPLTELVVSIPISARPAASTAELGNRVGVLPVRVPTGGPVGERLPAIVAITRSRKGAAPGASALLYGPFVRALARFGAFGTFIGHQRLVNTFLTNVRGPREPLSVGGLRIAELIPVPAISGNVGIAFAVLSYAGRLTVTVIADPDRCPDVERLAERVQAQLDALVPARPHPVDHGPTAPIGY